MTDLSYQTKKVYINKLLAFEEAYATGEVSVVLEAEPEPESHEHAAPSRPAFLTKVGWSRVGGVLAEVCLSMMWVGIMACVLAHSQHHGRIHLRPPIVSEPLFPRSIH